jgi:hypothetical protein
MDWTVYIPVAITGAVGLAGIGGSIWSARIAGKETAANLIRSIDAQNERAREAEKRRLYAASLAAFNEMMAACAEFFTAIQGENRTLGRYEPPVQRLNNAQEGMNRTLEELMLIAPKDVGVKAVDMANFYNGLFRNMKPGELPDAKAAGLMRTDLVRAMREDLGEGNW